MSQKCAKLFFCSTSFKYKLISLKIWRHVLEETLNKTVQKVPTSPDAELRMQPTCTCSRTKINTPHIDSMLCSHLKVLSYQYEEIAILDKIRQYVLPIRMYDNWWTKYKILMNTAMNTPRPPQMQRDAKMTSPFLCNKFLWWHCLYKTKMWSNHVAIKENCT